MEDGGQPEEVEGGVEAVVGNGSPAGSRAIGRNVIGFGRNIQRSEIGASQPRDDMRRHMVHHGVVGEIRERMSERRQFPRSEEHTSELQSLMRISYAVFC